MTYLRGFIGRLCSDEQGLETVEYAVMTALIVAGLVTAVGLLAVAVSVGIDNIASIIDAIV